MIYVGTPQEAIREDGMALDAAMKSLALSDMNIERSMRYEADESLELHLTEAIYVATKQTDGTSVERSSSEQEGNMK
jgi:hypothetical protein